MLLDVGITTGLSIRQMTHPGQLLCDLSFLQKTDRCKRPQTRIEQNATIDSKREFKKTYQ